MLFYKSIIFRKLYIYFYKIFKKVIVFIKDKVIMGR